MHADQDAGGRIVVGGQLDAAAVERHVLVGGELVELPGLAGRVEGGGCFPGGPAVVVADAGLDDGLARIEGGGRFVAPAAGEEAGLDTVIRFPDDQKMTTVLLEDHGALSSLLAGPRALTEGHNFCFRVSGGMLRA